ncbi:hypothetical protein KC19_6G200100 [Ceratodon purpureus]|uniref:Uncharacterized protein n=1 Tax=Ceratodon purpureus TaxID=3225 RepID=A0A8T0HJH5_CERPU|nr:hypothetical protein KC19_6G200100 [Ceratodon purpureus]
MVGFDTRLIAVHVLAELTYCLCSVACHAFRNQQKELLKSSHEINSIITYM